MEIAPEKAAQVGTDIKVGSILGRGLLQGIQSVLNVREIVRATEEEAGVRAEQAAGQLAGQVAARAGSGVVGVTGSPLEVAQDSLIKARRAVRAITRTGRAQARIERARGVESLLGGVLEATAEGFFGAAEVSKLKVPQEVAISPSQRFDSQRFPGQTIPGVP